jgi:hypothetical protein
MGETFLEPFAKRRPSSFFFFQNKQVSSKIIVVVAIHGKLTESIQLRNLHPVARKRYQILGRSELEDRQRAGREGEMPIIRGADQLEHVQVKVELGFVALCGDLVANRRQAAENIC